jgi:putative ABC transport system permease protein
MQEAFEIEGQPIEGNAGRRASLLLASDDYFQAMNIPLLRGRVFTSSDSLGSQRVVIINRSLARRYWQDRDPIGQRISAHGGEPWITIVGVVADVRQQLALEPVDEFYVPVRQFPWVTTNWVIRANADLDTLAPLVRNAVYAVDPDQPIHRLRTLEDVRAASLAPPALTATLLGLFAALALVITAAGIAGVVAFSVSQRAQEFGVRLAFGARPGDVVSMVLGEGIRLAITGLAVGLVGAFFLGGLLSTMLFGVEPTDAFTYVAVSLMLIGVAAVASLLPALRAASVDPIQTLRTT